MLEREDLKRYARQLILPEVGLEGQKRLAAARVLVVGLGGLGSPVAQYLAGAGVGTIGLCEGDRLEVHNLQRQTLYTTSEIGEPKLEVAQRRLEAVNPRIRFHPHERLEAENVSDLLSAYDLIVDATDNFGTRYLICDTCVTLEKTWVWGAAVRWDGMASLFDARLSLRDAFPEPPAEQEDCDTLGVHGPLLGVIGSVMASQAIKFLLGLETLYGSLWLFDALEGRSRTVRLQLL